MSLHTTMTSNNPHSLQNIPNEDFPDDLWEETRRAVQAKLQIFGTIWQDEDLRCRPCAGGSPKPPASKMMKNRNSTPPTAAVPYYSQHDYPSPDSDIQTIGNNASAIQHISFVSNGNHHNNQTIESQCFTPPEGSFASSISITNRIVDSPATMNSYPSSAAHSPMMSYESPMTNSSSILNASVKSTTPVSYQSPLPIDTATTPSSLVHSPMMNHRSQLAKTSPISTTKSTLTTSVSYQSPLKIDTNATPEDCPSDEKKPSALSSPLQAFHHTQQPETPLQRLRQRTIPLSHDKLDSSSASSSDDSSNPFGDIDFEPDTIDLVDESDEEPTPAPSGRRVLIDSSEDDSTDDDKVSTKAAAPDASILLTPFTKISIKENDEPVKEPWVPPPSPEGYDDVPSDEKADDELDHEDIEEEDEDEAPTPPVKPTYSKNLWLHEDLSSSSEDEEANFSDWTADFDKLKHPDGPTDEEIEDDNSFMVNTSSDDEENQVPRVVALPSKPRATPTKRSGFGRQRDVMGRELLKSFDQQAFNGRLYSVTTLEWSNKLKTTAGQTRLLKRGLGRQAIIELNTKVIDSEDRLRATLLHEMCHAAAYCLDGVVKPPHGKCFWKWANRAMQRVRPSVLVTTTHSYEIAYKYAWVCTTKKCGATFRRHSSSIDVTKQVCGKCKGRLMEVDPVTGQPKKKKALSAYNIFVKHNAATIRAHLEATTESRVTQRQVMAECSQRWRAHKASVNQSSL